MQRHPPPRPPIVGFTLVELLVVIAILGTLMAILVPAITDDAAEADRKNTEIQTERVRQDVLAWIHTRSPNRRVPQTLARLTEPPPALRKVPVDVWGTPLEIVPIDGDPLARFGIRSCGPDGEPNTDDDILAR